MTTRRTAATASAGALLALLTACGTTEATTRSAEAPAADASDSCAEDTTETATGPVSLTDSFGRTVELDRPAERVVVLEWQQTEDLLSLCVAPVAVADPGGFALWDTAEELPEGVADVGGRGEPNLDAIYAEDPDLVIVEAYTAEDEIIGRLERYDVPVLATTGADAADPIQNMTDTFTLIAEATGREERAEVVLDEFRATLAEARDAVAAADVEVPEFVYFDGYVDGGNISIRPFGQGSLMGELGEALGLTNGWTGEVDPAYGLGTTDVEGMTEVGDATLIHTGTDDPGSDVTGELEANPLWRSLPAVREGRVRAFPEGIWTFGGPRSAEQALEAYVDVVTG